MLVKKVATPLDLGKEIEIINGSFTDAQSTTYVLNLDAEAVLVSLFVESTAGDIDVSVLTEGNKGQTVEAITFPTVSAPTSDLLLKKSASVLRIIKIRVTTTAAATFAIRARGVSAGAASVSVEGSASFEVSQEDVTTTAGTLISASLTDRRGILIRNNSSGSQILYVADTLAKATTSVGYPVPNGGNITLDLQAGAEIFAIADSGTIDVRIVQIGG